MSQFGQLETGQKATDEQAEEVCAAIRQTIYDLHGEDTAESVRILYGGSVNANNFESLFSMKNIDGGLIGGASLKLDDFAKMANYES